MDYSDNILQNSMTQNEKSRLKSYSIFTNKYFWMNMTICSFFLIFSHKNLRMIQSKANVNMLYSINFLGIPFIHNFLIQNQKEQFLNELRLKYEIQKIN